MSEKAKETVLWSLAALLTAAVLITVALTSPDYQPPSVVYPEPTASETFLLTTAAEEPQTAASEGFCLQWFGGQHCRAGDRYDLSGSSFI